MENTIRVAISKVGTISSNLLMISAVMQFLSLFAWLWLEYLPPFGYYFLKCWLQLISQQFSLSIEQSRSDDLPMVPDY